MPAVGFPEAYSEPSGDGPRVKAQEGLTGDSCPGVGGIRFSLTSHTHLIRLFAGAGRMPWSKRGLSRAGFLIVHGYRRDAVDPVAGGKTEITPPYARAGYAMNVQQADGPG
jgi:hypothetical protein